MQLDTSFSQWLKQLRRELDLTQDELARRVGCAKATIQKIEADERRPSRQIAERLAKCLELSAEECTAFIRLARARLPVGDRTQFTQRAEQAPLKQIARADPGVLTYRRGDGSEKRYMLDRDVVTLGRSELCVVAIPLPIVSRLHARIELRHEHYVLYDADSANGTYVNGMRLEGSHRLHSGDEIWLGSGAVVLYFADPEETQNVDASEDQ